MLTQIWPRRLTSIRSFMSWSDSGLTYIWAKTIPALLTNMSTGPNCFLTDACMALICCRLVTSTWQLIAVPPCLMIVFAVSAHPSPSTSTQTTLAPNMWNLIQSSRPKPRAAPVIWINYIVRCVFLYFASKIKKNNWNTRNLRKIKAIIAS